MTVRRVLLILCLAACGGRSVPPKPPTVPPPAVPASPPKAIPPDPKVPPPSAGVRPLRQRLDFTLDARSLECQNEIDVELAGDTAAIRVFAEGLDLEEVKVLAGGDRRVGSVERRDEGVRLRFDPPIPAGKATLVLKSTARLDGDPVIFTGSHIMPAGRRRAFPVIDPDAAIPWKMTARVGKGEVALATASAAGTADEGGRKVVRFLETAPLPASAIGLVAGPLEVITAGSAGRHGTKLRFAVPRGRAAEARYVADALKRLVELVEETSDAPFPAGKLDVALIQHAGSAGASALPGLLVIDERLGLMAPSEETAPRQLAVATAAAQHLAGELLPADPELAAWLAEHLLARLEPRWRADARPPIGFATGGDPAAVLRMIERWLGEDRFRGALRAHLVKRAAGGFWTALDQAAEAPLSQAARRFLDEADAPLLSASLDCGKKPALLVVEQQAEKPWTVPLCAAYGAGPGSEPRRACKLVAAAREELPLELCPSWITANAGGDGVYLVRPAPQMLTRLLRAESELESGEKLALLDDARARVAAGELPLAEALPLVPRLAPGADAPVVGAALALLEVASRIDLAPPMRARFADLVRDLFGARARALGWRPRPNEGPDDALVRPRLVAAVAVLGKDTVLQTEAEELASRWLDDRHAVPPELVDAVLAAAASAGSHFLFAKLRDAARGMRGGPERAQLLAAMGAFDDLALANASLAVVRELDFADSRVALTATLAQPAARDLAYDFVKKNWDELRGRADDAASRAVLYAVPGHFCDAAHRGDAEAFFTRRVSDMEGGPAALARALARADACIATRSRDRDGVGKFLRGR
jgi:aminopeptidase N